MGKNAADLLFPGVRGDVLAAVLLHPKKCWYLSELSRHLKAATSHLHRELTSLAEAGILTRRVEGRQTYFEPDPACPFLEELTGLLRKLVGAPAVLEKSLRSLRSDIRCAFVHGSYARGTEVSGSDIDLFVVGDLTIADLVPSLQKAEHVLGRPVNPTVYPPNELVRKVKAGHHYIRSVMADPKKIYILGSADDLEAATHRPEDQKTSDKQGRARRAARSGRNKA